MSRAARSGLALVLALCVGAAGVALLVSRSDDAGAPSPAPSETQRPLETLDQQLRRVAGVVEDIRGLTFSELPEPTYLEPDALAERAAGFADEYAATSAETDSRVLRTLGAIPPGFDLAGGVRDLLSEQVAGFYDPETAELVVGAAPGEARLDPIEELFLAHELEHALADASLGLPQDPEDPMGLDAALAQTALVEGDASLTMQEYVSVGLSILDQLRLAGASLSLLQQAEVLESVPWVLRRSLEFPYLEGLAFVTQLRERGGWEAVDAAYRDPPTTTAQVLFPERYEDRVPAREVPPPGTVGAPWTQRTRTSFGAADLLFLFEAPGDDRGAALDDPRRHASRWGGGALTLWTDGDRNAIAIVLVEDRTTGDLCDSVAGWYLRAFPDVSPTPLGAGEVLTADGPDQDAIVRCDGPTVRLGIGPDLATARAAAG